MRIGLLLLLAVALVIAAPAVCRAAEVADAVTCLDVQDREPVEPGDSFAADVGKIWCWSKIKGGEGETIKHVYYHGDKEMAVVELQIRSALFRTYSSKRILPDWVGPWRVDIVDADGQVLKSLSFTIGETEPEVEESMMEPEKPAAETEESAMESGEGTSEAEGSAPKTEESASEEAEGSKME
jgi:hypothetical protein